jgi:aspartate/glutamate racemase
VITTIEGEAMERTVGFYEKLVEELPMAAKLTDQEITKIAMMIYDAFCAGQYVGASTMREVIRKQIRDEAARVLDR